MTQPVQGEVTFKPDNIILQAPSTNTGPITICNFTPAVAGGRGIEIPAGGNVSLPNFNPAEWYVVSTAGTQKLNIMYQAGPS